MESIVNCSSIKFYPLTFVPESNLEVTIGRLDIDSYALFPADGASLLQQMQAGLSPQQAAEWYEQHYGEPIDIEDFLNNLQELGFIRNDTEAAQELQVPRSLSWGWLGKLTFAPLAWCIYIMLFSYCLYDLIHFPVLLPSYQNIFFSPYFTLFEFGLFFGQIPGIFFHELYHILAGRRLGIPARLGLGHRLYFLVFETSLSGLWSVPSVLPMRFVSDVSLVSVVADVSVVALGERVFTPGRC